MKKRLEALRQDLNVQWKELADMLEMSVPMMGCLRRGERNPSDKLLRRIEDLESKVVLQPTPAKHRASVLTSLSRDGQPPATCRQCESKDNEIAWLKKQIEGLIAALAEKPSPAAARACGADVGGQTKTKERDHA